MAKTQFEALIEHIINDNTEAAKELLHDIVVAKSREIYNEMMEEEDKDESSEDSEEKVEEASFDEAGGDMTDDMIDDVEADETGMSMDDAGKELGDEMDMDDEEGEEEDSEHEASEEDMEDRIVDLEAALDDLKAEFDQLMSQEAGEEEHHDMGDHEMEMPEEGVVREYVEKVAVPGKNEGQTVGSDSSSKPSVNTKSVVAGKNDMGGTAKNLAQGGSEAAPDGTSVKKASNAYTKGQGEIEVAKRNVNQVGGNKGASDFYNTKAKAHTGEAAGTNDKSPLAKG